MFCNACTIDVEIGIKALMRENEALYTKAPKADMVNQPPHYTQGGIETIDYLEAKMTPEQFEGFCVGNALKYISRAGHKNDATEDYRKAVWYLNRMIRPEGN
jgi:hypothetical protein